MTPRSSQSVTDLLQARASRVVYDDLRRQARRYMRAQPAGHTLQTTALGHEAYLRLVGQWSVEWKGRAHSFGVAAKAMRSSITLAPEAGPSVEAGARRGVSPATVKRGWTTARAWLRCEPSVA